MARKASIQSVLNSREGREISDAVIGHDVHGSGQVHGSDLYFYSDPTEIMQPGPDGILLSKC